MVGLGVRPQRAASPAPWALAGEWELDTARTHYGASAEPRRRERFSCSPRAAGLQCRIDGERADGRRVTGHFTSPRSGAVARVMGVPGVDAVRLFAVSASVVDATFYLRGEPAFGYRAYLSADSRTLAIVAVDPLSRVALTTVVMYDRR